MGWAKSEMTLIKDLGASILNRECFEKIKSYTVHGDYNIPRV